MFGYPYPTDEYYESIINWMNYKHNWKIQREWLCYVPGIVKGIAFALHCFTQEGDKVIIQPPVYHPFRLVPEKMGREVVYNPLKEVNGRYEMDFEQLESIIDERCKVLVLSSPHNPGGVVWPKETLIRLAEICHRHGILVIADEIHSEMAFPQYKHHPFPYRIARGSGVQPYLHGAKQDLQHRRHRHLLCHRPRRSDPGALLRLHGGG